MMDIVVKVTTALKQTAHAVFWVALSFLAIQLGKLIALAVNGPTMLVF